MSRIKTTFNRLKKKNETALIPYIMAGDPDLAATKTLILEMEKAGCDIIELGAPFSDPLADGPTIQLEVRKDDTFNPYDRGADTLAACIVRVGPRSSPSKQS